jgi:adenine deaminase
MQLSGNLVDVVERRIFPGTLHIEQGIIRAITPEEQSYRHFILPGFVDAHVHIESSLLVPTEFARLATVHGTVAAVSDPHEIANVLGLEGVRFMLANAAQTPFQIAFGAPSCVPATPFETAGAELSCAEIEQLFVQDGLSYLSEVMNFPGVLAGAPDLMAKLHLAQQRHHRIDGHAPGLTGADLQRYAAAGITTDHECSTLAEAQEKLAAGIKVVIREGSAARNYAALHPLIASHADQCMFCSDDKHPDDLVRGHINQLVRRSVELGYPVMDVLTVACVNPVRHYGLKVGLLRPGDSADLIVVDNLTAFTVLQTYCQGQLVAERGKPLLPSMPVEPINRFAAQPKVPANFRLPAAGKTLRVIRAWNGQLLTTEQQVPAPLQGDEVVTDLSRDLLKLTVVNRYTDVEPAIALVQGFRLKRGAIASSVAHDSHNIVALGSTDQDLCRAVNAVIRTQGALALAAGDQVLVLPLPIAGLMSPEDGYSVARQYAQLDAVAKKQLGSTLSAPFMTLSFMALLVIPDLKLSDRGLFSGKTFEFVPLWVE